MISHAEILGAYQALLEKIEEDHALSSDLLCYEQYEIPTLEGGDALWFLYHRQATDFVREILNSLNQFRNYIARLAAWCEVLIPYSEAIKFELLIEFIEPIARCSLDYPYQLRNRLIYSACCLCDAANHLSTNPTVNCMIKDKYINFKTLSSYGSKWSKIEGLISALELVNNDKFKEKTHDFRNATHHRIPPSIEKGHPLLLTRMPSAPGRRRYGIGGPPPLQLVVLVDLLLDERFYAAEAYRMLWMLMDEQRVHFMRNLTTG